MYATASFQTIPTGLFHELLMHGALPFEYGDRAMFRKMAPSDRHRRRPIPRPTLCYIFIESPGSDATLALNVYQGSTCRRSGLLKDAAIEAVTAPRFRQIWEQCSLLTTARD
jgi:hypothetical protein